MKIVYLTSNHPKYDGRIYHKIIKALAPRINQITSINPNIEETSEGNISFKSFNKEKGLIGRLKGLINLYRIGKEENADVIIAPEPDSLFVAFILRKIHKNTVIFDSHEWYHVHYTHVTPIKPKIMGNIANFILSIILKYLIKRIDGVITVNDSMTNYYKKINRNSITIPSVMDLSTLNTGESSNLTNLNIIYFGQFGNSRQVEILKEAVEILNERKSNAKIFVVGGYNNNQSEDIYKLKEFINSNDYNTNFEYIGWVNRKTAFELLRKSDLGMMRFDSDVYAGLPPLPNKIFEYMSYGIGIIGSEHNVEVKNIINEFKCGITINSEDGLHLANSIIELENNPHKVIELKANAIAAVKDKYNWGFYGEKLIKFIKAI
ncbi:glycosyltransferase [Chryseomicrobium aureum]|uniref:glycosyltransferase n=1 Tax=Chryseomicrobium aureum TaxID=1441723 RepID=UPI00370D5BB0